jgi:hypothetical protein
MSKKIVLNNPRLNHLVMDLEMPIWTLQNVWADDLKTGKTSFNPTDSTVKSSIRRVMGHLKGLPPKPITPNNERDEWINNVTENVWRVCQDQLIQSIPKSEILICLVAIEDSIKTHTMADPRGYLGFLNHFFRQMGATIQEVDHKTASQFMTV